MLEEPIEVVEVRIPSEARIVNHKVSEALLPQGSLISLIIDPEGNPRVPSGDTTIHADDIVLAVTNVESEEALRNALTSP